jgi:hypothetical protein
VYKVESRLYVVSTQERIRDLRFARFDQNWAADFAQLLTLLEREGAPTSRDVSHFRPCLRHRVAPPLS